MINYGGGNPFFFKYVKSLDCMWQPDFLCFEIKNTKNQVSYYCNLKKKLLNYKEQD